jgi:hypothetical protein
LPIEPNGRSEPIDRGGPRDRADQSHVPIRHVSDIYYIDLYIHTCMRTLMD